jgi:hypothetical protein
MEQTPANAKHLLTVIFLPNPFFFSRGISPEPPINRGITIKPLMYKKMKPTISKWTLFLFIGNLFLLSCRKADDLVKPVPQNPPPVLSRFFQLTIDSIPGEPVAPVNDLFALVNVVNERNDTVLHNRKLPISFNGKFKTQELELPAATYRITKFWLINENNKVRFVTPIANSAKANTVSRPLAISFILPQPVVLVVPIEVAKVEPTDSPENFGYPAGSFNQSPGNPGEGNTFSKIKLRLAIQVGEIRYDSIPGTALYTTWDENQQVNGKYVPLVAGTNEITISRLVTKHHFRITKWGSVYELTLLKNEVKEGAVYTLGGSKQPKMLTAELTYKLVAGNYVAESKTSFAYKSGKLAGIEYYLKRADNSPYLAMKDQFQYAHERLERINRFDEKNQQSGSTSFTYNGEGKVNRIVEQTKGATTTATVDYYSSAETGLAEVGFKYSYSDQTYSMGYHQRYHQGNVISDNSVTANNNTETGLYDHDNQINPYAHMGWHNLFLSNNSKNNLVKQYKTYYGSYPVAVPYEFVYKYDSEGYPIELIRHYRSGVTNQFLYTTKTVFSY